jgi:RNA polymerase sigma-70 factor (ECF subfamily)
MMRPLAAEQPTPHPPDPPAPPESGEPVEPDLRALVADAAGGDERAWETIVSLYGRRIYAMARSRLHDAESAEEITQSVFATLAGRLRADASAYEERGRFESWLFRITMNRVRDEGRRRSRRATDTLPLSNAGTLLDGAEGRMNDRDDLAALRRAVASLDDRDREVVELRHHGQMPFARIADLLDEPMGTVLARHHRALKKIRQTIERQAEGGDRPRGDTP